MIVDFRKQETRGYKLTLQFILKFFLDNCKWVKIKYTSEDFMIFFKIIFLLSFLLFINSWVLRQLYSFANDFFDIS